MSAIEWTERTWNPVRGCSRVSPGCDHCYAMGQAHRYSGPGLPYEGLTTIRRGKVDWTGRAVFVPGQLDVPLKRHVFAPWKLEWSERMDGSFDLFSTDRVGVKATNLATVYPTDHWHTWDANGVGGENDTAPDVATAKAQAIEALARQHVCPFKGWARHRHMLRDRKGADPSEWPEDLRVREMPRLEAAK